MHIACFRLAINLRNAYIIFTNIYLHRFNDFGEDGGPAAKELALKLGKVKELVFNKLGVKFPDIEVGNSPLCIPLKFLG